MLRGIGLTTYLHVLSAEVPPDQTRMISMNFGEQAMVVIDERLRLQHEIDLATGASRRAVVVQTLKVHESVWALTCTRFSKSVESSTSQAYTDQISQLHRVRQERYEAKRQELQVEIIELEEGPTPRTYDRNHVDQVVQRIVQEVEKYRGTLSLKRRQLEVIGEYGDVDCSRWLAEAYKFTTRNPAVVQSIKELQRVGSRLQLEIDWQDFVTSIVVKSISAAASLPEVPVGDGIGLERHCAAILESDGWTVNHTPASGDQGVDLVARRGELVAALQCKNLTQPAGNYAVQEVYAGTGFYEADIGIVVATNGYTASAVQLARRLEILLLSPSDLNSLSQLVQRRGEA